MNPKFIISHLDVQLGPFDEAELKARWVKGELLPIDYVYDDGKQDWLLLSERFKWATSKAETATPPPLREITVKKPRVQKADSVNESSYNKKNLALGAKVKLVDGVGEIDLSPLQPGDVELVL